MTLLAERTATRKAFSQEVKSKRIIETFIKYIPEIREFGFITLYYDPKRSFRFIEGENDLDFFLLRVSWKDVYHVMNQLNYINRHKSREKAIRLIQTMLFQKYPLILKEIVDNAYNLRLL